MPRQHKYAELSQQPKDRHEFVYSLTCPLSGAVRYVGRTCSSLAARLTTHMGQLTAKKQPNAELLHWKQKLAGEGLAPIMQLIEEVHMYKAGCAERKWVRHFQRMGNPMLNVRHLLLQEKAHGFDLWELNDIADRHNMGPDDVCIGANICRASTTGFLSGAKHVARDSAGKIAQFLNSLPAEPLPIEDGLRAYVDYFLDERIKAIWTK